MKLLSKNISIAFWWQRWKAVTHRKSPPRAKEKHTRKDTKNKPEEFEEQDS